MKKQGKPLHLKIMIGILITLVLTASVPAAVFAAPQNTQSTLQDPDASSRTTAKKLVETDTEKWPDAPDPKNMNSQSAILMDLDTGTILYAKRMNTQRCPASITKIMTVMLVLENCKDLSQVITFSEDSIKKTYGSGIARDIGEKLTVEQCLYAVMLESANECAYALAEKVGADMGGDYQTFIDAMNKRAKELGCKHTHFTNCNGLPDQKHLTTAYDMALISREAYKNKTFRKLISTVKYVIPKTNKKKEELTMFNHHRMICNNRTSEYLYDPAVGGKTGYTDEALNTLVTYAEKDGKRLVCIVLRSGMSYQYKESIQLLEYGFNQFKRLNVSEKETRFDEESIAEEMKKQVNDQYELLLADIDPKAEILLPKDASIKDTKAKIVFNGKGEKLGAVIKYTYAGQKVGSAAVTLYLDQKTVAAAEQSEDPGEEADGVQGVLNRTFHAAKNGVSFVKGWLEQLPFPLPVVIPIVVVAVIILIIILLIRFGRRRRRSRKRRQMIEQHMGRSRRGPRW